VPYGTLADLESAFPVGGMTMDQQFDPQKLPVPRTSRFEGMAETVLYVARPGLRALPSGTLTVCAFAGLQIWTLTILLWAIWWPKPLGFADYVFSISATSILFGLVAGVMWLLLRKYPGFALAIARAPFISLTVTDRRVVWTLPWQAAPLMEIGRDRVVAGLLGVTDDKGHGSAALVLIPGDPSADIDGNIHFDRLPNVARFIAAFA